MIRKELFMDDSLNNIENSDLIIRFLSDETSKEESQLLINWLNESVENKIYFESIQRIYNNNLDSSANEEFNANIAFAKIEWNASQIKSVKVKNRIVFSKKLMINLLKAAAIVVFIFGCWSMLNGLKVKKIDINSTQSIVNKELPDGSKIALNKNSNIQYLNNFGKKKREITLTGEAFFEVKKDHSKPFIIHINGLDIQVVGTSFNVNAYSGEKTEVVVKTGIVKVINHNRINDTVALKAGERAEFVKNENKLVELDNKDQNYLSWKTRVYVFDQTPMTEVAKALEKDFNITISFENDDFKNCLLFAKFENQSLNNILNIINHTFNIDFVVKGKNIVFKGKGC